MVAKTVIFQRDDTEDLTKSINAFLEVIDQNNLIDIKFNTTLKNAHTQYEGVIYTALILYKS